MTVHYHHFLCSCTPFCCKCNILPTPQSSILQIYDLFIRTNADVMDVTLNKANIFSKRWSGLCRLDSGLNVGGTSCRSDNFNQIFYNSSVIKFSEYSRRNDLTIKQRRMLWGCMMEDRKITCKFSTNDGLIDHRNTISNQRNALHHPYAQFENIQYLYVSGISLETRLFNNVIIHIIPPCQATNQNLQAIL